MTGIETAHTVTGQTRTLPVDDCFIAAGLTVSKALARGLAEMDERGFLIAGEDCATSLPGLYAAGDVRKKRLRQIVTAVADGANAVAAVQAYLAGKA